MQNTCTIVFPTTLVHGNSKNDIKRRTEEVDKMGRVNMESAVSKKKWSKQPNCSSILLSPSPQLHKVVDELLNKLNLHI